MYFPISIDHLQANLALYFGVTATSSVAFHLLESSLEN